MKIKTYFLLFERKSFIRVATIALLVWLLLLFHSLFFIEYSSTAVSIHGKHAHHGHDLLSTIYNTINLHWFFMLTVMMLPLLFLSIEDVCKKNFKRKRKLGLIFFFTGYILLWTIVGIVLSIMTYYLNTLLDNQIIFVCFVLTILMIWQVTPYKKISLNRCHLPANINPFGMQAGIDSFKFGIQKAFYCIGTCWPVMWLCIIWMQPTMLIMPVFTLLLLIEQIKLSRRSETWGLTS